MSCHAGTHVDAPLHFVPEGAGIDSIPLERFMGPALVHHVDADRPITEDHVSAIPLEGATRVRLVGLDYLSVAHADTQVPVHRAFLDHGVVLLEGIELSEITLRGLDGAPCRGVLRNLAI